MNSKCGVQSKRKCGSHESRGKKDEGNEPTQITGIQQGSVHVHGP